LYASVAGIVLYNKIYDRGSAQFITYVAQNISHGQKYEIIEKVFV